MSMNNLMLALMANMTANMTNATVWDWTEPDWTFPSTSAFTPSKFTPHSEKSPDEGLNVYMVLFWVLLGIDLIILIVGLVWLYRLRRKDRVENDSDEDLAKI
jgi:hypothetical protein